MHWMVICAICANLAHPILTARRFLAQGRRQIPSTVNFGMFDAYFEERRAQLSADIELEEILQRRIRDNNLIAETLQEKRDIRFDLLAQKDSSSSPDHIRNANVENEASKTVEGPVNEFDVPPNLTSLLRGGLLGRSAEVLKSLVVKQPLLLEKEHETSPLKAKQIFSKYKRPPEDRFFSSLGQQMAHSNWMYEWTAFPAGKAGSVMVGNDKVFTEVDIDKKKHSSKVNVGWKNVLVQEYANSLNEEIAFGMAKGRYGAFFDYSARMQAVAVEALSKFVEVGALFDLSDHRYGAEVRVRQIDIALIHSFNHQLEHDHDHYATSLSLGLGPVGIVGGIDITNARYSVGVGIGGTSVTIAHDFDDRITRFLAQFGKAWELSFDTNLMDAENQDLYGRLGFGRLAHRLYSIGAGITSEGLPMVFTGLQLPSSLVELQLSSSRGGYILQYAFSKGTHTDVWRVRLIPENIRIPTLFNVGPQQIHKLLFQRHSDPAQHRRTWVQRF